MAGALKVQVSPGTWVATGQGPAGPAGPPGFAPVFTYSGPGEDFEGNYPFRALVPGMVTLLAVTSSIPLDKETVEIKAFKNGTSVTGGAGVELGDGGSWVDSAPLSVGFAINDIFTVSMNHEQLSGYVAHNLVLSIQIKMDSA